MSEPEPTEIVATTAAIAVRDDVSPIVALAAPLDQLVGAFRDYTAACDALLVDADYQRIGDKLFRKKSAWRKLATSFNVSDTIVSTVHEREVGVDGFRGRIIRTEVVVRAVAPNGRTSEGLGACDLYEKCCHSGSCRNRSNYHTHCDVEPNHDAGSHFSHAQHDIPATAATRAKNRALADLFGMGEVSAEEVASAGTAPEWERLDWPSEDEYQSFMEALVATMTADPELAAEWKGWRAEQGLPWPLPHAARDAVESWLIAHGVEQGVEVGEYVEPDGPGVAQDAPDVDDGTPEAEVVPETVPGDPGGVCEVCGAPDGAEHHDDCPNRPF